jgi:hypothetical protein
MSNTNSNDAVKLLCALVVEQDIEQILLGQELERMCRCEYIHTHMLQVTESYYVESQRIKHLRDNRWWKKIARKINQIAK